MNIIDALQALKDGKKIRMGAWKNGEYFMACQDGMIINHKGEIQEMTACSILTNKWELYTEPTQLTAEERKALELAKECGYDLLWYDACYLWAHVRGENETKVADDDFPPLRALKGLFPRATNPTSIDSLLEGTDENS